jgi:hypothetical protein
VCTSWWQQAHSNLSGTACIEQLVASLLPSSTLYNKVITTCNNFTGVLLGKQYRTDRAIQYQIYRELQYIGPINPMYVFTGGRPVKLNGSSTFPCSWNEDCLDTRILYIDPYLGHSAVPYLCFFRWQEYNGSDVFPGETELRWRVL